MSKRLLSTINPNIELMHKIKQLPTLFFFLLTTFIANAGIEESSVYKTGVDLNLQETYSIQDSKLTYMLVNGSWSNEFVNKSTTDIISIGFDREFVSTITAYDISVNISLQKYDMQGMPAGIPENIVLQLDYDPVGGVKERSRSSFKFTNCLKYEATVTSVINNNGGSTISIPANMYLDLAIETERYYTFDFSYVPVDYSHFLNPNNKLLISWDFIEGAEAYDVEWTYVNDYTDNSLGGVLAMSTIDFTRETFKFNSSRVTTTNQFYEIPLLLDRGYLVYRIRGLGKSFLNSYTTNIPGAWSTGSSYYSTLQELSVVLNSGGGNKGIYYVANAHELSSKNWQVTSSFAEEGKRKDVVSYFDGSLRNRQSVTQINTNQNVIVGETLYDFEGRPAINVLPTPSGEDAIKYVENFNQYNDTLTNTLSNYDKYHFDIKDIIDVCSSIPKPMAIESGASKYYGQKIGDGTYQDYVPDAEGYPFTVTTFTPDNTGRIAHQSGVGEAYKKIAVNHLDNKETKYYYGQPDQEDLDALFGSNVGYKSRYKKNMVVDANGQVSVTYTDAQGRTIATALAGNNTNLLSKVNSVDMTLDNRPEGASLFDLSNTTVTKDLLNKINIGDIDTDFDDNNQFISGTTVPGVYDGLVYMGNRLVESQHEPILDYTAQTDNNFTDACLTSTSKTYNFVYDLIFSLKDECGEEKIDPESAFPEKVITSSTHTFPDVDLTNETTLLNGPPLNIFETKTTDIVNIGSYQLSKKIQVNSEALDYFADRYYNDVVATCTDINTYQDFYNEQAGLIDVNDCNVTCEECVDGLVAQHGLKANADLDGDGTHEVEDEVAWQLHYDECMAPCSQPTLCDVAYNMMLLDVSPGGQYWGGSTSSNWSVSVLNSLRNPFSASSSWQSLFASPINGYSVQQLEDNWEDEWAEELVQYHPEWCYYNDWCSNLSTEHTTNKLTNNQFTQLLSFVGNYGNAGSINLTDPNFIFLYGTNAASYSTPLNLQSLTNLINADPFFYNGGYANNSPGRYGENYKLTFLNAMSNYNGLGVDLFDFVAYNYLYGRWYGSDQPSLVSGSFSNLSPSIKDELYPQIIAMYNAERTNYMQRMMQDKAILNQCYNGAFSNASFNPFMYQFFDLAGITSGSFNALFGNNPSSTTYNGFFDLLDQESSLFSLSRYENKQPRFMVAADYYPATTSPFDYAAEANAGYYAETGRCPMSMDLELLLNDMVTKSSLTTTKELHHFGAYTFNMYNAITTISYTDAQINTPFTEINYTPSANGSILNGNVNYTNPLNNFNGNLFTLIPTGTMSSFTDWNNITNFSQLTYTSDANGVYSFSVMGIYNNVGTPVEIVFEGTTPIKIGRCEAEVLGDLGTGGAIDKCTPNAVALELLTWINIINSAPSQPFTFTFNSTTPGGELAVLMGYSSTTPITVTFNNNVFTSSYGTSLSLIGNVISNTEYLTISPTYTTGNFILTYMTTNSNLNNMQEVEELDLLANFTENNITTGLNLGECTTIFNGECADNSGDTPDILDCSTLNAEMNTFLNTALNTFHNSPGTLININSQLVSQFFKGVSNAYIGSYPSPGGSDKLWIIFGYQSSLECEIKLSTNNSSITWNDVSSFSNFEITNLNTFGPGVAPEISYSITTNSATTYDNQTLTLMCTEDYAPCDGVSIPTNSCENFNQAMESFYNSMISIYHTLPVNATHELTINSSLVSSYFNNVTSVVIIGGGTFNSYTNSFLNFQLKKNGVHYCDASIKNGVGLSWHNIPYITNYTIYNIYDVIPVFSFTAGNGTSYNQSHPLCNTSTVPCGQQEVCTPCIPTPSAPVTCANEWLEYSTSTNGGFITLNNGTTTSIPAITDDILFCELGMQYAARDYVNYLTIMNVTAVTSPFYVSMEHFGIYNTKHYYAIDYVGKDDYLAYVEDNDISMVTDPKFVSVTEYSSYRMENYSNSCIATYMEYLNTISNSTPNILTIEEICNGFPLNPVCFASDPLIIPTQEVENPCVEYLTNLITHNAETLYKDYVDSIQDDFKRRYIEAAMNSLVETFTITENDAEYHYTLYEYDQSGSLVRTIPPQGVKKITGADLNTVKDERFNNVAYGSRSVQTAHTFATTYTYNTLNQLKKQRTPDGGISEFWYDALSRIILSQNAEQKLNDQYSYSFYDALGRINEAGQVEFPGGSTIETLVTNQIAFEQEINGNGNKSEITKTFYDESVITNPLSGEHNELRNRIAHVTYGVLPHIYDYDYATHYLYDIHGNVSSMVQDYAELDYIGQRYKRIDYEYDLISGNVNKVSYQKDAKDEFFHEYDYDADNRIVYAKTSNNGIDWEEDANYQYYDHGPLARVETGDVNVQGTDYAYTIQGWLKGVNSNTLKRHRDMGKDGLSTGLNSKIAEDVFGFSLGYFNNDYKKVTENVYLGETNFLADINTNTTLTNNNLYNGNITHMATAIKPLMTAGNDMPQTMVYSYDLLNRIAGSEHLATQISAQNEYIQSITDDKYKTAYTYDQNGNITTLKRNDENGILFDNFTYHYINDIDAPNSPTNRLGYVGDDISNGIKDYDIDDQVNTNNYEYNKIGQLVVDKAEGIEKIYWNNQGKVTEIIQVDNDPNTEFRYGPMGNRILKIVKPKETNGSIANKDQWTTTYYVRDAQGNVMGVYDNKYTSYTNEQNYVKEHKLKEHHIYGSDRLAVENSNTLLTKTTATYSPARTECVTCYDLSKYLNNYIETHDIKRTFEPSFISNNITDVVNYLNHETGQNYSENDYVNAFAECDLVGNALYIKSRDFGFVRFQAQEQYNYIANSEFTIQVSFNKAAHQIDGNKHVLVSNIDSDNNNSGVEVYHQNGKLYVKVGDGIGFGTISCLLPPDNTWNLLTFVAFTHHVSDYKLYLNDVPQNITIEENSIQSADFTSEKDLYIGNNPDDNSSTRSFWGYLRNVKIFKYPFDRFRVKNSYNNPCKNFEPIFWAKLNEHSGITVQDYSDFAEIGTSYSGFSGGPTYQYNPNTGELWEETHFYNFPNCGDPNKNLWCNTIPSETSFDIENFTKDPNYSQQDIGDKNYELKNHLGNVLAVVTDRKLVKPYVNSAFDGFESDVVSANNYYPFGMTMQNDGNVTAQSYRYGFQGQEKDDEIKGNGNSLNYKYRMHDPRLGRFFAIDPLTADYPHYTPYSFSGNKVIHAVELEGLEEKVIHKEQIMNIDGTTSFNKINETIPYCSDCPNFQGVNKKGRYGIETTAKMLDGTTQSNYLDEVTIFGTKIAKTEAKETNKTKLGNGYSAEQNIVIGLSKILPGPNLVHAFSSIIAGEDAVGEKQEGGYNRVVGPVITIGTSFFGVSGLLTSTTGKVNTTIDVVNNVPTVFDTGNQIYKNHKDSENELDVDINNNVSTQNRDEE